MQKFLIDGTFNHCYRAYYVKMLLGDNFPASKPEFSTFFFSKTEDDLNGQLEGWLSKAKDSQKPARAIIAPYVICSTNTVSKHL